jgi:hypothetical protein
LVEKRLIEELLPIARYIQVKYREGRIMKVRWLKGNQPYDAILKQTGSMVEFTKLPTECFLEATCAVHDNEYLLREAINNGEPVFGVRSLMRDKKTRKILSTPVVREYPKFINDFSKIIINRIRDKDSKGYPNNTVLIVDCRLDTIYLKDEWDKLIDIIKTDIGSYKFMELFLYDGIGEHYATLYPAK